MILLWAMKRVIKATGSNSRPPPGSARLSMHASKLAAQTLRGQSFRNGVSMPLLASRPRTLSRLISKSASPRATATASMAEADIDYKALLPDYNFLRSLVKTNPLVLDRPVPSTEEQYFQLPLGTLFAAPSRELGLQMKETFALALKEKGLVIIELGFEDPESQFMLELVEAMGCVPDTHSSTQGALVSLNGNLSPFLPRLVVLLLPTSDCSSLICLLLFSVPDTCLQWDVTYKPSGVMSAKTGTTAHSHSHGDGEFAWHTDGCFEVSILHSQAFHPLH